ncbi:cytochrome oxidase putative small subunit CydP [Legionella massiliensis]|uniref:cytochrome oxidase putative small subunit CydP n=1 Tax=Legionella massiliensis TaxID=1034943 RepID=UPI00159EC7B0|nr:cytochrome oxidase putative small subunit CydP [Legionella massiliensis]
MKTLTRDICVTLIVKFSLFFMLWFICIKGVEKPAMDMKKWLLGTGTPAKVTQVIKTK